MSSVRVSVDGAPARRDVCVCMCVWVGVSVAEMRACLLGKFVCACVLSVRACVRACGDCGRAAAGLAVGFIVSDTVELWPR